MPCYNDCLRTQIARRNAALASLKNSFSDAGNGIKSEIDRLENSMTLERVCSDHPWAAVGIAVGAGVIASKLLAPNSSAAQQVVVEVRHTTDGATVTPAQPAKHSMIDQILRGVANYEVVQSLIQGLLSQTAGRSSVGANEQSPTFVETK